ncbi:hypothetical protein Amet_4640 [Alkaliphilus metalliredigens QYMF]|uniref:Uncharacterized protein n=1 Tax=Alkaliphilus metalliredigens (strain QYMF) TaxID=293826 RepID=A6TWZ3_ALKMQ|nr:hypothetical protein [Alkaliphilus metalliredigens]ABR50711.1 hypothetical protein Amet_4640 [Alkaliphilus metalliredigens QYMF]
MLYLRMGPRFLFIRTERIQKVKDFFLQEGQGIHTTFQEGLEQSTEDSTLIFITEKHHEKTSIEDAKEIILVNEVASACLAGMINHHVSQWVFRVDMGPASMVMRVAGDEQKIIQRIQEVYGGKLVDWEEGVKQGEKGDTILSLTKNPISGRLSSKDFINANLLLAHPVSFIHKKLRNEGLLFITQSLENSEWYDLQINIYDSWGNYKGHHDRLIFILSQLEIGMILGETWTKDHALILYSVIAFQVRLFTTYSPQEIKKLTMALEYDQNGERQVDFDLYYRNKKISWVDIDKRKGRRNKLEECKQYREELFLKLSEETQNTLIRMEKEIKATHS